MPLPSPPPLSSSLLRWFDASRRDLPWRATKDPYAIWLSEVMLQQTQVTTVIPYWRKFLARFPDVEALAAAELPEVLSLWQGLGYYSRARNLHRCAKVVASAHGGKFPASLEGLLSLPGFGRYTAGAVASIAFGLRAPLVDGNVARVFSRLFEVEGAPPDRAREKRLWEYAEALVPAARPGDFNQALMELGATVCRPENPACGDCPVQRHCGALASGRVDELPGKKVRAARKQLRLTVAAWERDGALLFGRRFEKGLFGGLWELPSVEGDSFRPLLGVELRKLKPLGTVSRTLTHRDLRLDVFAVSGRGAPKASSGGYQELRWATPKEAESFGISTAMQKAVELARSALTP